MSNNNHVVVVILARRGLDGFRWYGSYTCIDRAIDAARANPGVYELREVPTGRLIDTLNTYCLNGKSRAARPGEAPPDHTIARRRPIR